MKYCLRLFFAGLFILILVKSSIGEQLFFERVTGDAILPNTPIHGIAKDSIGYLWFGSWNGVYRYDGVTFDLYRHNADNENSIPNNRIRNLITDQNKSLWLLTFDRKYVKYKYSQDHFETIPDSIVPAVVISLLNSSSNNLNRNSIINDNRYFLSSHHLTELNIRTKVVRQFLANYNQPGGLLDDYISSFFIDDQQILWIGTRSGDIYKANTNRKPFDLHYCYENEGANIKRVSARALLKMNNELWIGTNNNGMLVENNSKKSPKPSIDQKKNQQLQIRTLLDDNSGKVWIGGVDGLDCFYPASKSFVPIIDRNTHPELTVRSVYAIEEDSSNRLWVGLYNGIARINLDHNEFQYFDLHEPIGDRSVMDLLEDNKHRLWLATEGSGIIRIAIDNKDKVFDTVLINSVNTDRSRRIIGDMVYSLYEDCWGNVWAGTTDGLNRIDANTLLVQHFTEEDGLPDVYISSVTGDEKGNIWVAHKKGISRLETGSYKISNYSISDKNGNWTFLDGACYKDTVDKTIYFGAREGYVAFEPDMIKADAFPPKLVLKTFYISGNIISPKQLVRGKPILNKVLSQTQVIYLDYPYRNFAIEMAALHFENPVDNKYVYKLHGYDEIWTTTSQNKVSYTKVPAGKYAFVAKALSPDNSSSNEVELRIIIKAPWYASYWAIVIYIFFVLFILFFVYREILSRERLKSQVHLERLKVEKQEELNREKLEFFTNVSHELRTPLTLIIDPLKQLQDKKLSVKNRDSYLSMINRNVDHLTKLINQLLDFRKAEAGKLVAKLSACDAVLIVSDCLSLFYMNAKQRDIRLDFRAEVNALIGFFDKEKLQQIIMNLISNAFKYTPNGGEIVVTLFYDPTKSTLNVIVKDNGIGIEAKSIGRIFEPFNNEGSQPFYGSSSGMGLALTHHLVKTLNGEINIDSIPKKGTTVNLCLPFQTQNEPIDHKLKTDSVSSTINYSTPPAIPADDAESKSTLLIVEDNADVQEYLAVELGEQYFLLKTYNGKDGFENALKHIPDLIISDIMMPEMDGKELCQKVKTNEQTCHIPVILLTAKATDENQIEGLQTGADMYITKPFSVEVLKAQIESIIANRKRIQEKLAGKSHIADLVGQISNVDNGFLLRVVDAIKENIDAPGFGSDQLAVCLSISQRQLYRKLKAISGSTVHEFITRVRMDEAANLLVNTALNVSQIAYRVGYSEPSNFSRTFTKQFNCSPTKYAKTLHSKK